MSNPSTGPMGLVVVDKPAGVTSHDVVARIRKVLGLRRVGHAGTLDPPATGVLLIGVGRFTRALRFLTALPKTYTAELVLGATTDTLDDTGTVQQVFDMADVGLADLQAASRRFVGEIEQVPPMVSAVRVGGRRLHEMAREGLEVERDARTVVVHSLDVSGSAEPGVYSMTVSCGAGTYIRALGNDLATAVGGGGHIRRLRRTAVGSFRVDEAATMDSPLVLDPLESLRDYERTDVDEELARRVRNGAVLGPDELGTRCAGPVVVAGPGDELLAVYELRSDRLKPTVVFAGG